MAKGSSQVTVSGRAKVKSYDNSVVTIPRPEGSFCVAAYGRSVVLSSPQDLMRSRLFLGSENATIIYRSSRLRETIVRNGTTDKIPVKLFAPVKRKV